MELNKKQTEGIEHFNGPMMVLAGPGSGKTTVITYRVKNLIEKYKVSPNKILVITFTKAAAMEMEERFKGLDEICAKSSVSFGTFHSVFFRILRSALGYKVEDILREEEKYVIKNIVNSLNIDYEDEDEFFKEICLEISLMKNELIDINCYNTMVCSNDDFRSIANKYEEFKKEKNKIDFDDMLCLCYKLFCEDKSCLAWWQNRYDYILIDEFQDINRAQYEVVKMLSEKHNNLFIVGDDDQSIYKFRGARPEFLLRFPEDFSEVKRVILDINYRSTDNIINLAGKAIKFNESRYQKNIKGTELKGDKPILLKSDNVETEAALVAKQIEKLHKKDISYGEMAVIYRTNIQAKAFVEKFMDLNYPFYIRDEMPNIFEHWVSKDILAYIKLSLNMSLNDCVERIINKPKRYVSKVMIQQAKNKKGSLLYNIINSEQVQVWQRQRLEDLDFYLRNIKKKTPYEAIKYIKAIVGYDEYLKDYAEFRKIGVKGLIEVTQELMESAKHYNSHEEFLNYIEDYSKELKNQRIDRKKTKDSNAITLTTMHASKGLEFEAVFIISAVEGVIPHEKSKTISEIEEERRLFYVGITRAKRYIYISVVDKRYEERVDASRFLKQIGFE